MLIFLAVLEIGFFWIMSANLLAAAPEKELQYAKKSADEAQQFGIGEKSRYIAWKLGSSKKNGKIFFRSNKLEILYDPNDLFVGVAVKYEGKEVFRSAINFVIENIDVYHPGNWVFEITNCYNDLKEKEFWK